MFENEKEGAAEKGGGEAHEDEDGIFSTLVFPFLLLSFLLFFEIETEKMKTAVT